MRWTTQAAACLVAIALAGCGPRDRTRDSGAAAGGGPGTETGTMSDTGGTAAQPDMTHDTTGMGGMPADTAQRGTSTDTNQTESGVTDSSGKSTLGTSKGDTINAGVDSAAR